MIVMIATILYQIILGSVIALIIGGIFGGIIGSLMDWIFRREEVALFPAIAGSSLGVLITAILPLMTQSGVVNGGAYAAIYLRFLLIILMPLGLIGGAIIGGIAGLIVANKLSVRTGWLSFLGIYILVVAGFYLTSPPN